MESLRDVLSATWHWDQKIHESASGTKLSRVPSDGAYYRSIGMCSETQTIDYLLGNEVAFYLSRRNNANDFGFSSHFGQEFYVPFRFFQRWNLCLFNLP
jgi:hypothetical protein